MSMPFYVSPEQVMKDKADYARKGIARGRSVVVLPVRRRHPVRRREPVARAAQDQRDLRPDRVRRGRPVQRVREPAHGRGPATPTCAATSYDRRDVTARGLANAYAQTLGTIFTEQQQAVRGRDRGGRGRRPAADADQIYRLTYDGSVVDEHGFVAMGGQAEPGRHRAQGLATRTTCRWPRRCPPPLPRSAPRPARPATAASGTARSSRRRLPVSSRWPCWTAPGRTVRSGGWPAPGWRNCWPKAALADSAASSTGTTASAGPDADAIGPAAPRRLEPHPRHLDRPRLTALRPAAHPPLRLITKLEPAGGHRPAHPAAPARHQAGARGWSRPSAPPSRRSGSSPGRNCGSSQPVKNNQQFAVRDRPAGPQPVRCGAASTETAQVSAASATGT